MYLNNKILVGKNEKYEATIVPRMVNRHGLITGASGSGKTTSVKVLAESFADAGIPVFMIDVKGDLAGTCKEGEGASWVLDSKEKLGLVEHTFKAYSVNFFDVFKTYGLPIRTTVSKVGSKLLTRMLGLSEVQEGVLAIAFQIAEEEGLKLYNLNDLKMLLSRMAEKRDEYSLKYGNVSTTSVAAIQRNILELVQEGGDNFFGEPELDLYDLLQYDYNGKGFINILDAQILYKHPTLYACVLVWLLNTLYDNMPEVGDLDRPKLALFLDEAHLIFSEMSPEMTKKIIQIIKLIRSKGIGVYFISQSPSDIPEEIIGQLGNKIQHVLRSYTPNDEKAIKAAANSYRPNPEFNTVDAIKELSTGEALVSFLTEDGEPNVVERVKIVPPQSNTGTISDAERDGIVKSSRFYGKYITDVNSESAEEIVSKLREEEESERQRILAEIEEEKARIEEEKRLDKEAKEALKAEKEAARKKKEEEREAEKKKKNDPLYKLGKKAGNKAVNKVLDKSLNKLMKGLFK